FFHDRKSCLSDDFLEDWHTIRLMQQHYEGAIFLRRYIFPRDQYYMRLVRAKRKYTCWQSALQTTNRKVAAYHHDCTRVNGELMTSEATYNAQCVQKIFGVPIDEKPVLNLPPVPPKFPRHTIAVGLSASGNNGWPNYLWRELIRKLVQADCEVHLFGGPDKTSEIPYLTQNHPSVISHIGRYNLRETAALLQKFQLYVGNDTGLSHLASLTVPETLILLGGGTFPRFFPWPFHPRQYVILVPMPCYECCWDCRYGIPQCMEYISPEIVFRAIMNLVEGKKHPKVTLLGDPDTQYHTRPCGPEEETHPITFSEVFAQLGIDDIESITHR
ncbi:MAG: hypothetical protein D6820_18460, partial [Lentisphaerae bacterium]